MTWLGLSWQFWLVLTVGTPVLIAVLVNERRAYRAGREAGERMLDQTSGGRARTRPPTT